MTLVTPQACQAQAQTANVFVLLQNDNQPALFAPAANAHGWPGMPLMISVTPVHEHIDLTPLLLGEVMEQGLSCCVSANSNGVDIDPPVFQGL